MAIFAKPIDQMTAQELQQAYEAVVREYIHRRVHPSPQPQGARGG